MPKHAGPRDRWFISGVETKAFKSVGSRLLKFPLTLGLTCIVGPNGSGKSNLLDAVCFACGCSPAVMGVQRLADLQCTDVQEVCEASVAVTHSMDGRTHIIKCELAKDLGRGYRLDGRLKTGKEIKAFLKERAIDLDQSCCLIRQAHVTQLADNNSTQQLAMLIHDTSGYTRWSNEAAAALEELKKTNKALQEISGNVKCLEVGVAEDEVKYGAAARLAQLDTQLLDMQQVMATCLHARQADVGQDIQQAQNHIHALQEGIEAQAGQLAHLEQQSKQLQGTLAAVCEEDKQSLHKQRQTVAAAEEEVHMAEKQCVQARQAVQEAEQAKVTSTELQAQLFGAEQALHSQQQFVTSLQAAAEEAAQGSEQLSIARPQQLLKQLQEDVRSAQGQVQAAEGAKAGSQQSLLQAQQELDRAQARLAALPMTEAEAIAELVKLRASVSEKEKNATAAKQQAADQCRQSELQRLALGSLVLHALRGSGVPRHQMLHECFCFKEFSSDRLATLMEALNLIAGDKLSILLVENAAAAADVLAWYSNSTAAGHSKALRVWDLQRLQSYDKLRQQKQAQAQFPSGHVIIPLELFEYQPAHHAAMVRAFGGLVIVKDDATAAKLVTQHGLACITLDGKISRPGSMQGGWRGHVQPDSGPMARKLAADHLQEAAATAEEKSQRAAADCQASQNQLQQLEGQAADLASAQEDVAEALQEVQHLSQEASAQQQRHRQSEEALQALQAHLHQAQQLVSTCTGTHNDAAHRKINLTQQLQSARLKAKELAQQQEELAIKVEEAADHAMMTTEMADALHVDAVEQQLLDRQTAFSFSNQKLQELQAQALLQASASSDMTAQLASIKNQHKDITRAMQSQQQNVKAAQSTLDELHSQQKQIQKELQHLIRQVPELTMLSRCHTQHKSSTNPTDAQGHAKQLRRLQVKCRKLQEERKANKAHQVPPHEQMQFEGRKADLALFKERAEALQRAVVILEEGIAASRAQVVQADEAVFDAVQAKFLTLTTNLLPKLELKVERAAKQVHQGLHFKYRSRAASGKGEGWGWQSDLSRLSGGERTLVSLALVLSAATAGAKSALFLMDEVDAALDESNQALVATLIQEIMAQEGGCQVLFVTHNPAFQQICSSMIQVGKTQDGTTIMDSAGK